MFNDKLTFLSNNCKRSKASKKRLKLFEYFRNLGIPAGFLFLQGTHSSVDVEKQGNNAFQGQLFFSNDNCGVAIGYYGKNFFRTSEQI